MALNINGTTGISGVDGSASAPALTGTDSNTGINFASDTVNINTGGSTRAIVDSAGRLLIGTTTEGETGGDQFTIAGSGNTGMTIRGGTTSDTNILFSDGTSGADEYRGIIRYQHNSNQFEFFTDATRRFIIDSSGRILLGTDSAYAQNALVLAKSSASNISVYNSWNLGESGTRFHFEFRDSSGGGSRGNITTNGGSTSYNTSSDYRLKENVIAISDGITRLKTLKPSRFNFKDNKDTTVDGFLAHEVTAVPEAITGTKDETQDILYTEEDTIPSGKKVGDVKETVPIYQGIDQGKLVPLLTAALQEAVTKIETLETKVAALEGS